MSKADRNGMGGGRERKDGRLRSTVNQTNIGTAVSKATLGKLLRDEVERIWLFWVRRYHLELN